VGNIVTQSHRTPGTVSAVR